MICYRIVKSRYQNDLSGEGAERYGGRWNSIGTPALYCCENRSLAMLEILANTFGSARLVNFVVLSIEVPDELPIYVPLQTELPGTWNAIPMQSETQRFGDRIFQRNEFVGFRVPSTLMHLEFNYVFNPLHVEYPKIRIIDKTPLVIDARL